MKIGCFANINGDYKKLKSTLSNLVSENIDALVSAGNLVTGNFPFSTEDKDCLDMILLYQDILKLSIAVVGYNENLLYENIRKSGLDDRYQRMIWEKSPCELYLGNHVFVYDTENSTTRMSLDDNMIIGLRSYFTDGKYQYKTFRIFKSEKVNVVIFGNHNKQGILEITNGIITRKRSKTAINPESFYVICPSSEYGGYCILDNDSISLA